MSDIASEAAPPMIPESVETASPVTLSGNEHAAAIAPSPPVEPAIQVDGEQDVEGSAPQSADEAEFEEEDDGEYSFTKIKFVPTYEMDLDSPSIIIAGLTLQGSFKPFKFLVNENTTIGIVERVLCDKIGCCPSDIGFFTAGWTDKHRQPDEKLSDIFGPDAKEGIAYRFARKEMMQVSVWPTGYEERKAARIAQMQKGPMHGLGFDGKPLIKEKEDEIPPKNEDVDTPEISSANKDDAEDPLKSEEVSTQMDLDGNEGEKMAVSDSEAEPEPEVPIASNPE